MKPTTKKAKIQQIITENPNKKVEEIYKLIEQNPEITVTRGYVSNLYKRTQTPQPDPTEKPKTETEKKEKETKPEQQTEFTLKDEPTPQEIDTLQKIAQTPKDQLVKGIMEGKFNHQFFVTIWSIESKILKTVIGYEHDKETIELLASLWESPINDLLQKHNKENVQLYTAIGLTLILHIPIFLNLWSRYTTTKQKKKEEKLNVEKSG